MNNYTDWLSVMSLILVSLCPYVGSKGSLRRYYYTEDLVFSDK